MLLPSTRKHDKPEEVTISFAKKQSLQKTCGLVAALLSQASQSANRKGDGSAWSKACRAPQKTHFREQAGREHRSVHSCPSLQEASSNTKAVLPPSLRDPAQTLFLPLLQSYAYHPWGRRELLMPEQQQNHPTARPQGNSRLAALTSNGAGADNPAATSQAMKSSRVHSDRQLTW